MNKIGYFIEVNESRNSSSEIPVNLFKLIAAEWHCNVTSSSQWAVTPRKLLCLELQISLKEVEHGQKLARPSLAAIFWLSLESKIFRRMDQRAACLQ
ncbi:hypothetical protein OUZ56_007376 [Daphnia magna]|uniref:Uncharacterized protein n=1 Tax=Daphnia magna TaxID=35525 RepID=A0ABR0A9R9_9CRUS|nr:hypothetical protein OUZ56_007376 [Daphnia magna]